jgi:hypothetical protein
MQWELSTWSKHVQRLSIEKNGNESDKAALPTGKSRYNKPHKTGTFKRKRNRLTTGVEVGNHHNGRGRQSQHYQHYQSTAAAPAGTMKNCQNHLLLDGRYVGDKGGSKGSSSSSRR